MYLMTFGGFTYLVTLTIKQPKVPAFEEFGLEVIHEFKVKGIPVTVVIANQGESVCITGSPPGTKRSPKV